MIRTQCKLKKKSRVSIYNIRHHPIKTPVLYMLWSGQYNYTLPSGFKSLTLCECYGKEPPSVVSKITFAYIS